MTIVEQIQWPTWVAIAALSWVLGIVLGQIIHERRLLRPVASLTVLAAIMFVTVSTWR